MNGALQINASRNGQNLNYYAPGRGGEIPIIADGGNWYQSDTQNSFYWETNSDGTISLKNVSANQYLCVDSGYGNNPTKLYANKNHKYSWEKFYAEVADAPIGCVVALKSLNSNCIDNNGNQGQKYLYVNSNGEIYANIWRTDDIIVIDPKTGAVIKKIDMSRLLSDSDKHENIDVLNGIAYNPDKDVFYVTGKYWPKLFEVVFEPK